MYGRKSGSELLATGLLAALAATALAATALPSHAQTPAFYVAGDLGASRYRVDLTLNNVRIIDNKVFQNSVSTGVALGWQFMPSLSLELGYIDFGKTDLVAPAQLPCLPAQGGCNPIGANLSGDVTATAAHVSLVGRLPIAEKFALLGRAGIARAEYSVATSVAGVSGQSKENRTQGIFGIGASYAVTPAVEGLIEWKWVGSAQVSTAGVGLRVRF